MYRKLFLLSLVCSLLGALGSCSSAGIGSEHLVAFHEHYADKPSEGLRPNALQLYVDNSRCIVEGQHSSFYQTLVPVLTRRCQEYYSIKGPEIVKEDLSEQDAYKRLLSIEDISYAALKEAAERIARGDSEAVLLTDCEYYEQTIARGNVNNAYLEGAFTTWLERGHDIFIIAEPYVEQTKKGNFAKKRYYIVFTNNDLEENIYAELSKNVNLNAGGVQTLHLSASNPLTGEARSVPDETLAAQVSHYKHYEVQDWGIEWSSIQSILMGETDLNGNPSPKGGAVIRGLMLEQSASDLLRIDDVRLRIVPLNATYTTFVQSLDSSSGIQALGRDAIKDLPEAPNFMLMDNKEWRDKRELVIYLDRHNFDPTILDNSAGGNFFRIDVLADKIHNALNDDDRWKDVLTFDDIAGEGKNVSLYESVKICLNRPSLQNRLKGQALYSIYVSTFPY